MKKHYAISVMGKDVPGIVATVSKVLFETGCNIEDSAMTILRSEFAMILIVELPQNLSAEKLGGKLISAGKKKGLTTFLKPLTKKEGMIEKQSGKRFMVSVYGADKPGIVYTISRLLAESGINITDVQTNIRKGKEGLVYIMLLEIEVPVKIKFEAFKSKLERTAGKLNVNTSIAAIDQPEL